MKESSKGTFGGKLALPLDVAVEFSKSAVPDDAARKRAKEWGGWIDQSIIDALDKELL